MELIGLYRNKDKNRTKPFGHRVCGLRCEDITIHPKELLEYLRDIRFHCTKEEAFDRLQHYVLTLNLCFPPNSNARNEQPQVDN